jgi:hypothetical protein
MITYGLDPNTTLIIERDIGDNEYISHTGSIVVIGTFTE